MIPSRSTVTSTVASAEGHPHLEARDVARLVLGILGKQIDAVLVMPSNHKRCSRRGYNTSVFA